MLRASSMSPCSRSPGRCNTGLRTSPPAKRHWPLSPAVLAKQRDRTKPAPSAGLFLRTTPVQQGKPGILIADDEPAVRSLLEVVLQRQGFTVWQAASGDEALELYQEHSRQTVLVILDVRMPGRDGLQTLAALQQLNPAVVCCFVSGQPGDYREADLMDRGTPGRVLLLPRQTFLTSSAPAPTPPPLLGQPDARPRRPPGGNHRTRHRPRGALSPS